MPSGANAIHRKAQSAPRHLPLPPRIHHTLRLTPGVLAAVPLLEVWDTSQVTSLQQLLAEEQTRVEATRQLAKEGQRKALRVNCDLDLKRIEKIDRWCELVKKDPRREW